MALETYSSHPGRQALGWLWTFSAPPWTRSISPSTPSQVMDVNAFLTCMNGLHLARRPLETTHLRCSQTTNAQAQCCASLDKRKALLLKRLACCRPLPALSGPSHLCACSFITSTCYLQDLCCHPRPLVGPKALALLPGSRMLSSSSTNYWVRTYDFGVLCLSICH